MSEAREKRCVVTAAELLRTTPRAKPHRSMRTIRDLLSVVTVHIPLQYNANKRGVRTPVEQSKITKTLREAQTYFSGFSILQTTGWCRGREADGTWDDHLRIEVDVRLGRERLQFLSRWKQTLKKRFEQDDIYVRITGSARWL